MQARNFTKISQAQENTSRTRRRLLQLSAALPVSMPVISVLASSDNKISYHQLKNQESAAGLVQGAVVLVDGSIKDFQGNGFYLYPDWGQPVVYEVRQKNRGLAFYYPGSDQMLWESSHDAPGSQFSGRVEGVLKSGELLSARKLNPNLDQLPALQVPRMPVA